MLKTKCFVFVVFLVIQKITAQTVKISGVVESKTDVENIHVINKTAQVFTITDKTGTFYITAKRNDTIVFSSIQHQQKEVVISEEIMLSKALYVSLQEQINELDEVLIGKVLTGDLLLDINNVEGKPPINFYDVGIPGYTGKLATQSERRLYEAGEFKPAMLLGLLLGHVPLNPILNGISGRTKMLKDRVDLEAREALIQSIKRRMAKRFFENYPLDDDLKMDFFYFCAEDETFLTACKNQTDFTVFLYLEMKYKQYIKNKEGLKN